MKRRPGRGEDPNQLPLAWADEATEPPAAKTAPVAEDASSPAVPFPASRPPADVPSSPALRLPWDFVLTFPMPMAEALDAGVINEDDATPENVRVLHDEHARQALAALSDRDAVLDARRRNVDPRTGKTPLTAASRERLRRLFEAEPDRLDRWYQALLDTYEEAFGPDAAEAFDRAVRARHAGVEVIAEEPKPTPVTTTEPPAETRGMAKVKRTREPKSGRVPARLPNPRPLDAAVAAGRFGREEDGGNVRPGPNEVRALTEAHAEKLIDLLDAANQASGSCLPAEVGRLRGLLEAGLAAYAEDFGAKAAEQLGAYVRREAERERSQGGAGRRR